MEWHDALLFRRAARLPFGRPMDDAQHHEIWQRPGRFVRRAAIVDPAAHWRL
jgi:hypothetical protein